MSEATSPVPTLPVPEDRPDAPQTSRATGVRSLTLWWNGLFPLFLTAGLVLVFLRFGPVGVFRASFPPVEELTVERITLPQPGELRVRVVNGGPEPVTIAQVLVDDAVWAHTLDGPRTIQRLDGRTITIPYPWVEGEAHEVSLLTSTGLTFAGGVEVATQTPGVTAQYVGTFALLGIYVGVIPIFLGLLWLPFLRGINQKWMNFFLSLTMGLLVFLGMDTFIEALETAGAVPGAFQGSALVLMGVVGTPLALAGFGHVLSERQAQRTPLYVAALIALGIGLHNLGEGLVIGAGFSNGEIALSTFLVLGFLLHNTTEGLAIVAPLAAVRPRLGQLVGLGLLAGLPTILGAWIGGFTYSPITTTLFFAIGTGAILQVVYELWRFSASAPGHSFARPLNAAGLLAGILIMYATGLFVAA